MYISVCIYIYIQAYRYISVYIYMYIVRYLSVYIDIYIYAIIPIKPFNGRAININES